MITQEEFNEVSRTLPVLVNARPFGRYSMVDIDAKGGLPVIVAELLGAGLLDGDCITCTGETLAGQVARLAPPAPDGEVIHPLPAPFKPTGACGCSTATSPPTAARLSSWPALRAAWPTAGSPGAPASSTARRR